LQKGSSLKTEVFI